MASEAGDGGRQGDRCGDPVLNFKDVCFLKRVNAQPPPRLCLRRILSLQGGKTFRVRLRGGRRGVPEPLPARAPSRSGPELRG